MELELAHACRPCPGHGLVEQRGAHTPPAVALGDHQSEVRDVPARRMRVAGERQAADDTALVVGHEHGRVRVPLDRA
jgi:hypothetical protein